MKKTITVFDAGGLPCVTGVRFLPIQGNAAYCVGDDGSVWSRHVTRGKKISSVAWRKKDIRRSVQIFSGGTRRHISVAKLVLGAFVGPCPEGSVAMRLYDMSPLNNRLDNLCWIERCRDHVRISAVRMVYERRRINGHPHPLERITDQQIAEIRGSRGASQIELSRKYKVSTTTIRNVIAGNGRFALKRSPDGTVNPAT